MEKSLEKYIEWADCPNLPRHLKAELDEMRDREDLIKASFGEELTFGTSGIRGIMGVGPNRFNHISVNRASCGLASYLLAKKAEPLCIVAYDSRKNSRLFAYVTAKALANKGVKVKIFDQLVPVSTLSYEIRRQSADCGVIITASHNPKEYNGYKVYNDFGGQLLPEEAKKVTDYISAETFFAADGTYKGEEISEETNIPYLMEKLQEADNDRIKTFYHPNIEWIYEESMESFIKSTLKGAIYEKGLSTLKVVYSPLNGAGLIPVRRVLKGIGISNLHIVSSQELPNGEFPTCPRPNPERAEVYGLGQEILKDKKGDILIITDPDCDRVGMATANKIFSGNEIAVLLLAYLLERSVKYEIKKLAKMSMEERPLYGKKLIRSIVSTGLADELAAAYGVLTEETLIGFKYIGAKMETLDNSFFFGFEEGNGYQALNNTRDKDGVSTAMLICEMAAYYKERGIKLTKKLESIYKKYGHYKEKVLEFAFEGIDGNTRRSLIMNHFRERGLKAVYGKEVEKIIDYKLKKIIYATGRQESLEGFDEADIIEFIMPQNKRIVIRPSGTEPKIKVYLFVKEKSSSKSDKSLKEMDKALSNTIMDIQKAYLEEG